MKKRPTAILNVKWELILLFLLSVGLVQAQEFKFLNESKSQTMKFEFVNDLIILPIEVNGLKYKFILDSGMGTPVIFNLRSSDSLSFLNSEKIKLRGLGGGDAIEALKSIGNEIKLGEIVGTNQGIHIVYNNNLNISGKVGFIVNGVIGYSILKDFVVEINYETERITFTKPENFVYKRCDKCETFDLTFYKNKPYLNGEVVFEGSSNQSVPVQLLVDSGSTDALWLFEDRAKGIYVPEKSFEDFIGEGMSGSIYGMRSKIDEIRFKSFNIKNSNVAYLDSVSTVYAKKLKTRNGSLGGNILKRFNIILDYKNSKITLKKNYHFNNKFIYNMSGVELIHAGKVVVKNLKPTDLVISNGLTSIDNTIVFDYREELSVKPAYRIAHLRSNSTGELAGLKVGDQVLEINGKSVLNFELKELIHEFYATRERKIRMIVFRGGRKLKFEFKLENML